MILIFSVFVGCATQKGQPEIAVTPPEAAIEKKITQKQAATSDLTQEDLIKIFSLKDGGPSCMQLQLSEKTGMIDLLYIVDNVRMPPYAGMRSAKCMIDRYPIQGKEHFVSWMQSDNTKGLAILLANNIDLFPADVAQQLTEAGLNGPHKEFIVQRLTK